MVKISASILSANFASLKDEIIALDKAGADYIHFDIMDNHFVPNLTFGVDLIATVREFTNKPFDVHLMVTSPEKYFEKLKYAGADYITFHVEATAHHDRLLSQIKELDLKSGLALNPSTPLYTLDYLINKVDLILIMTVNPGFGGQTFLYSQLDKIKELHNKIKDLPIELSVDGGVNLSTAPLIKHSGANILTAGSFILGSEDYAKQISLLKNIE